MEKLTLKEQNAVLRAMDGAKPKRLQPPSPPPPPPQGARQERVKHKRKKRKVLLWMLLPVTFAWAVPWVLVSAPLVVVFPPLGMALWAIGCAPIAAVVQALVDRRQ